MAENPEGQPNVPVDRDFVRKMGRLIQELSSDQQETFSEMLRHAAEPDTFLSRQEFEAQKEAEAAKHGLTPDNIWAWLEYHWLYPPVGKIGADWSYPEESAAGWDYPEYTEAAFLASGGGAWEYSDYVSVFWGVVAKHLLDGGNWDSIPWAELAAPSELDRWSIVTPEDATPQRNFGPSYERFLRGAYVAANGQPGVRVHRDTVMQASELDSLGFYIGMSNNMAVGNVDGPRSSDDWITFVLTPKAIQEVQSTTKRLLQ